MPATGVEATPAGTYPALAAADSLWPTAVIRSHGEAAAPPLHRGDRDERRRLRRFAIGGTLTECDPFVIRSTSHWTGAAIIVKCLRTKTCIVTRPRTSPRLMPSSLVG